jgi:hypothetical protein
LPGSYHATVPRTPTGLPGAVSLVTLTRRACGTAVTLADLELDCLTLAEQLRPAVAADDLGGVHEEVLAAVLGREEPEAPLGVEPADCCLGHGDSTSR